MPLISMFYGITIRMNWEAYIRHHTPHFHAYYQGKDASFTLSGQLLSGEFPNKQASIVKAWAVIHEDELIANWELAEQQEEPYRIDPLK